MESKEPKITIFKSLYDTYAGMDLPVKGIDTNDSFTINNLRDLHPQLPFSSIGFRPQYFSFLFVKDAHGTYTTDDQSFKTVPGTIYFTNPGHFKSFEWHDMEDVCLITFTESFLKENVHPDIFKEFPFLLAETVNPRVLPPQEFEEFERLYLQIEKDYHSDSAFRYRIIGSLMVVVLLKIKEYFWNDYNPIYEGNRSSQIVKTFKRNLEQHFRDLVSGKTDKPLRVQDYADMQFLHVNYLSNVISNKTGKSISAWIADKTIAEAKVLLQDGNLTIKEVAHHLGFLEAPHFSNYFKKHTALSPVEYRKQRISDHS